MKRTSVALLLVLVLCSAVPSYSKFIYVRNGSGASSNGCGLTTGNACPTIQSGINNAASGDIVSISSAGGNYTNSGNWQLTINKDLTLLGDGGVRIDGQGSQVNLVNINNRINRITFDTIEFWRGFPAVSITNSGPITFKMCKFINNNYDNDGSAVNIAGGQVTFDSCTFSSNSASGGSDGGAVFAQDATTEFTNCTFTNNHATQRGGAVRLTSLSFGYFYSCNFTSNTADSNGGAISTNGISANGEVVVEGCQFYQNTASRGGAIELSTPNSVHMWGSVFSANNANNGDGGALSISGTPVTIPDIVSCVFSSNTATNGGSGGAIASATVLLITDSVFSQNSADTFSFGSGEGGGAIFTTKNLTVDRCVFDRNSVPAAGGAIYLSGGILALTNSVFTGNNVQVSGGAVYVLSSVTSTVRNCTFSGNYASGLDAGAFFTTASLMISDSIFRNNSAADSGGAMIVASSSSANFSNVLFDSNSASGVGGGLFCSSAAVDLFLNNVNFTSNSALQKGGGLRTDCATTLVNSFFTNNYGALGGALYSGGPASVSNSQFSRNSALNGGAIAAVSNGEVLYIANTYITSNIGLQSAGGIFAASSVSVSQSYFWNNTASGPAGAIRLQPSTSASLTLTECSLVNNSATVGGSVLLERSATVNIVDCEMTTSAPEDVRVRLNVDGRTHSISGMATHLDNLYVEYGSINLDGNFVVGIVTLDGQGILGGSGNASISSSFQWLNGSLAGIGYLTAADKSTANVTGSGQHLLAKPFVNKGHMLLPSSSSCLTFANNSTLYNQLYGEIDLACNMTGTGMISNAASIMPSSSVQISQSYYEAESSSLVFYLRPTEHDRIDFTSDVNLRGAVRLEPVYPYAPNVTNVFTLVTSSTKNISGSFSFRLSSNLTFALQYGLQQVNASIISAAPILGTVCTSNAQCRSNSNCNASCVTGYCLGGSLTCPSGQTCNLQEGYCGVCNSHSECRSNTACDSLCISGACQTGSLSCSGSQTCNVAQGTCDATVGYSPSATPSGSPASDNNNNNANDAGNSGSDTNTLIGVVVGVGAAIIVTVIISTVILKMRPSKGNKAEMSTF